jgi:hypothetical protein
MKLSMHFAKRVQLTASILMAAIPLLAVAGSGCSEVWCGSCCGRGGRVYASIVRDPMAFVLLPLVGLVAFHAASVDGEESCAKGDASCNERYVLTTCGRVGGQFVLSRQRLVLLSCTLLLMHVCTCAHESAPTTNTSQRQPYHALLPGGGQCCFIVQHSLTSGSTYRQMATRYDLGHNTVRSDHPHPCPSRLSPIPAGV